MDSAAPIHLDSTVALTMPNNIEPSKSPWYQVKEACGGWKIFSDVWRGAATAATEDKPTIFVIALIQNTGGRDIEVRPYES
ncbi:hypothetical protein [Bradyrhizobium genosp. A]|uniref:hypothetical protein n=1 Tax=Bradyrhizobium genosp. A TaxID=83626 RepID=UPI003CEEC90A